MTQIWTLKSFAPLLPNADFQLLMLGIQLMQRHPRYVGLVYNTISWLGFIL